MSSVPLAKVADTVPVGASFVFVTVSVKVSDTDNGVPALSVAVTFTSIDPTSSLSGVPENILVCGLNESHAGNGLPFARVAESVKASLVSTSAKVFAGI